MLTGPEQKFFADKKRFPRSIDSAGLPANLNLFAGIVIFMVDFFIFQRRVTSKNMTIPQRAGNLPNVPYWKSKRIGH
jgi:hypothetical protein